MDAQTTPLETLRQRYKREGCTPEVSRLFQKIIYNFYRENTRVLPWRTKPTPYRVFVSEVMLQQTQVPRVIEKFNSFVQQFPTFEAIAQTQQDKLLAAWSGLGYNRRALHLKKAAESIVAQHKGKLPDTPEELMSLPGIGPATAASIIAFTYNKPVVFIETNIRSVFIHCFFSDKANVTDKDILPLVEKTLDLKNPRVWYSALMDFGSVVKKEHVNPSRKSKHYTRQSPFKGSDRQIRGLILKTLLTNKRHTLRQIITSAHHSAARVKHILATLEKEGFITRSGKSYTLIH